MEAPPPLNSPPLPAKPDSNEKLLIIYLVKKGESEKITAHAREALNFHISLFIYGFCSVLLCVIFIGIPLLFALAIMALVLPIVAAVKASDGGFYRYPLTLRLVA